MNVLVYAGPGVSPTSLSYTISTLKLLLEPNYAVQMVTPKALASEPWAPSCALLVIPGGRDIPYLSSLSGSAMNGISRYVREGGKYLGICAGAYFASARVEWEVGTPIEVVGNRPLKFFPGTSRGCVYPGFQYESENGARSVSISLPDGNLQQGLYYNGGGELVIDGHMNGVTALAYYVDSERPGMVAGVLCDVGSGKAALWHVHLEYSLNSSLAINASARSSSTLDSNDILKAEEGRKRLVTQTLEALGFNVSSKLPPSKPPAHPLPQLLCASEDSRGLIESIFNALSSLEEKETGIIDDINDKFKVYIPEPTGPSQSAHLVANSESEAADETRHIIVYNKSLPSSDITPHFSIPAYFETLETKHQSAVSPPLQCPIGKVLLYGEAVASTQTLLEKNPKILEALPVPILSLATYQLSGRGRGSNVWASPLGCLQWSLLVQPPPQLPNNKLVFIQYLVGLAVVEACREVMGPVGHVVVLKWPNDIYARVKGPQGEELRKIGGILVNTVFMSGGVRAIIGCGLNVLNEPPILSLSQLVPKGDHNHKLTMEYMAATIMSIFGRMWNEFVSTGSFEPFMDLYLDRWIHSDQLVTLETVTPPIKVRIVGITPEHGLLRTVPDIHHQGHNFIDLQPDGNSFDMMAGLIKAKR